MTALLKSGSTNAFNLIINIHCVVKRLLVINQEYSACSAVQCSVVQRVGVTQCHLVVYFENDAPVECVKRIKCNKVLPCDIL